MPCVSVDKIELMTSIGKRIDDAMLENIMFDFGVELDDVYEEGDRIMYKFDIPANRYDLLCLEGLSHALRVYMGMETYKDITMSSIGEGDLVTVRKHQTHERSHIACAIIKGIEFTDSSYGSFIGYQDKLHCSIGRNRSLVAIGTHDLSKIDGQIEYRSANLKDIDFVPLSNGKSDGPMVNGLDLETHFAKDRKISKFFSLLSDGNKAVTFTCNGEIMSIPPIINSDKTKISKETRDIFVEVTGTDFNKVNTVLKLILYNFRGEEVQPVKILDEKAVTVTPVFNNHTYMISAKRVSEKLHLDLSPVQIQNLLERMIYKASIKDDGVVVDVLDVRSDVMHECDIMEDIAISHGFNNFEKRVPPICTVGHEDPLSKFSDKVRLELALSGYSEVLTLTLLSKLENFVDPKSAVVLSNPKSREYEVVRTSLLPGILKSISSNLHGRIPIKVFEVADVVLLSDTTDEGAKNERRACAVIASNRSLLEDAQGPLSLVLEKCGFRSFEYVAFESDISSYGNEEYEAVSSMYLENQGAFVKVDGEVVGTIGVLHPAVCQKFSIPYAASSFEIDVDSLLGKFVSKK